MFVCVKMPNHSVLLFLRCKVLFPFIVRHFRLLTLPFFRLFLILYGFEPVFLGCFYLSTNFLFTKLSFFQTCLSKLPFSP
ncbi:unnamed protein product [Meloidogyne enterolobii]|uniref:Uncharacterized protein n=1 Tax=Meloidogyne enterolobii TaxID=390850 RepID=A0ACB1AJ93_MELEN